MSTTLKSREARDEALTAGGLLRSQRSHRLRQQQQVLGHHPAEEHRAAERRPRRHRGREEAEDPGGTAEVAEGKGGDRERREKGEAAASRDFRGFSRPLRGETVDLLCSARRGYQETWVQGGPRHSGKRRKVFINLGGMSQAEIGIVRCPLSILIRIILGPRLFLFSLFGNKR